MNDALRPRSIAELLDHTVELYRRHFVLLLGIPVMPIVPVSCLVLLLPGFSSAIALLIMIWLMLMASGAMSYAVARIFLKEPVTILGAWNAAFLHGLSLTVAAALAAAGVGVALLVALAGVFGTSAILVWVHSDILVMLILAFALAYMLVLAAFAVQFILAPTVVMVETIDGVTAMRRSIALVRATWRHVWACQTTMGVFAVTVTYVLSMLGLMFIPNIVVMDGVGHPDVVQTVFRVVLTVTAILSLLLIPLHVVLTVLLYFDARIRLEGFDIEMLAERFGDRVAVRSAESDGAV